MLAFLGIAFGCTLILVFLASVLRGSPLFLQIALLALCALYLPVQIRLALRPHRPPLAARSVFLVVAAVAVVTQLLFIGARPYFSDDALRHMYDGLQLLQGNSIYVDPPASLGPAEGIIPNHPELPTVYLPFTQLQAYIGGSINATHGFAIVYHALLALFLMVCFVELPSRNRRVLALLVLSPFFLIASASRHADAQGMLLVIVSLTLCERGGRLRQFGAGFTALLLPALKPIGIVWSVFLLLDLLLRRGKRKRPWLVGGLVALAAMAVFSVLRLWRDPRSFLAFLDTAQHFGDWFVAYNPFVIARSALAVEEQKAIIVEFRREILAMLAMGLFLLPLAATARNLRGTLPSQATRLLRRGLREALVWVLVLGTLAAGVWHPWYFLWWLPALVMTGRFAMAAFLPGILVLFYVPIPILRTTGQWDYELFVFAAICYLSAWFWLTRNRRRAVT